MEQVKREPGARDVDRLEKLTVMFWLSGTLVAPSAGTELATTGALSGPTVVKLITWSVVITSGGSSLSWSRDLRGVHRQRAGLADARDLARDRS